MTDVQSSCEPPSVPDLQLMLWCNRVPRRHFNEVWPDLYIGDAYAARDKATLHQLGITHVLNAASGKKRINTGPEFYKDINIDFFGVEASDDPSFDMSRYFHPAAQFIRAGLESNKGKVLVHCGLGISRASSLVVAFLMICEGLSLMDALQKVSEHRYISPNRGFLEQLRQLDIELGLSRKSKREFCKV
ncbi:dual specificity protein phosphatase 13-like [Bombina bombina]|uniref:dual specificity protein phosphatase 13-like n=1 Tax=Bombina bombina TaxID=8345 RepID=UPI00235AF5D5|nr:dual specificity protein phosphatase 13-like [Bombina bombina]